MKKLFFPAVLILSALLGGCIQNSETQTPTAAQASSEKVTTYGEKITPEGAIATTELPQLLANKDSAHAKIETNVLEVCQVKGCWMEVNVEGQERMRVTFKNYAFKLPQDMWAKK